MRRSSLFWGFLLILAGILFLLNNLGILAINVWDFLWPLFLVALGINILWHAVFHRTAEVEQVAIPLENAGRARLHFKYGAGRLEVGPGAAPGNLVEGEFAGGVDLQSSRQNELLDVTLSVPVQQFPLFWNPGEPHDWTVRLAPEVPFYLKLETGANESRIDLQSLKVSEIQLSSGASSTVLILPENAGFTRVMVEAGAAAVRIIIPSNVAARIQTKTGLSSVSLDTSRFQHDGTEYRSANYETAENKAEMTIQSGVGSITIQ